MTIEDYRAEIRAAVRGFWSGAGDYDWFLDAMFVAIERQMPLAYHEGAAECGIAPDEITFEERMDIQRAILEQKMFVAGFADHIEQRTKTLGGKLGPLFSRVDIWVQRYNEVRERAKGKACADQKAVWIFGQTEMHCEDCLYASGRVYRLSIWDKYGYVPGSHELACGGWRCDCRREMTDEPITKGFPRALRGR